MPQLIQRQILCLIHHILLLLQLKLIRSLHVFKPLNHLGDFGLQGGDLPRLYLTEARNSQALLLLCRIARLQSLVLPLESLQLPHDFHVLVPRQICFQESLLPRLVDVGPQLLDFN